MCYPLFAPTYANTLGSGKVASAMLGYGTLALAIWLVFYILRGIFVPRLTGSNFFGGGEYYLGMVSGMIRFACMLLAALALLNARPTRQADIQAHNAYKQPLVWRRDSIAAIFFPVCTPCRSRSSKNPSPGLTSRITLARS